MPCGQRAVILRVCVAHAQRRSHVPLGSRCIHARASQILPAELLRKTSRGTSVHRSPGAVPSQLKNIDSRVVLMPTDPHRHAERKGRSNATADERRKLQMSASSEELLRHLNDAIDAKRVDVSVFAVAMQRCGQYYWWEALLEVRRIQKAIGVELNAIGRNICLTALGKCVRGGEGCPVHSERRSSVLSLGKEVWNEVGPATDADTFQSGLGAALKVCSAAGSREALEWAEDLWAMAAKQHFPYGPVAYSTFALVLEQHGLHERVDALLRASLRGTWTVTVVTLGALVNAAGDRRDWRRAELLWQTLTTGDFAVQANAIAHASRAKVHLLCGRPGNAAAILENAFPGGKGQTLHSADILAQARLLTYHSSLDVEDLYGLQRALSCTRQVMVDAGWRQAERWKAMERVAKQCERDPSAVGLSDALVNLYARTSVLAKLGDLPAGSRYLCTDDADST
eukprot:TRINITY_DN38332_c0_g1_i1.p1 TRINITY_DN38332_c0_g1~~TRINITY_DN38332_c0_g1_i1.p1  ORF type:complete len:455 (-),score=70.09 TRINITY_DN38332_c0_g1_i1:43-1407(-)